MADTITHTWQTVELAAVTLNCSTRTIARRIAGGTIESRVDDNGRRLVLVETYGNSDGDEPGESARTTDVGQGLDGVSLAVSSASVTAPVGSDLGYGTAATSVLAVLQSSIQAARNDAARARSGARWAWAGVAAMAVAAGVTGLFITGRLTRAEVKVEMLQSDVATARTDLDRSRNDLLIVSSAKAVADQRRDTAEQQLTAAEMKQQAALSELASVRQQAATELAVKNLAVAQVAVRAPATQPAFVFGRFVNLPTEPEGR